MSDNFKYTGVPVCNVLKVNVNAENVEKWKSAEKRC